MFRLQNLSYMKILLLFTLLVFFNLPAIAQAEPLNMPISSTPADSIPALLCKKWIAQYTKIGDREITPERGAPIAVWNFKKDKSLLYSPGDGTLARGTWTYDRTKKCIYIRVNGHPRGTIVQLESDLLVMLMRTGSATSDDSAPPTLMVFNVKTK